MKLKMTGEIIDLPNPKCSPVIRTIGGSKYPTLLISRELRLAGFNIGDSVAIIYDNKAKIVMIVPAEVKLNIPRE